MCTYAIDSISLITVLFLDLFFPPPIFVVLDIHFQNLQSLFCVNCFVFSIVGGCLYEKQYSSKRIVPFYVQLLFFHLCYPDFLLHLAPLSI